MKMLVTGGCGFIGSHLVDRLVSEGHSVTVIDNLSSMSNATFYYNPSAQYYQYDICDFEKIKPLFFNVDYVFHMAAESKIQPIIDKPKFAADVNIMGTCNVLEASKNNSVKKVVYSSTSAIYGLSNPQPLNEEMEPDCLNPYSYTKLGGELLCKMYNTLFGLNTITLRYFNVYGERQPVIGIYTPVVGLFMGQIADNKPMTIVGDGLQRRDFVHVSDIVEANILAAQSDVSGIYNIGTGRDISVLDLAKLIGDTWEFIPERKGESRETLADNTKAREILKWNPTITIEEWIENNRLLYHEYRK